MTVKDSSSSFNKNNKNKNKNGNTKQWKSKVIKGKNKRNGKFCGKNDH